jgi:hypothetical protein
MTFYLREKLGREKTEMFGKPQNALEMSDTVIRGEGPLEIFAYPLF